MFNPNWLGVLSAGLAIAAFFAAYADAKRKPAKPPIPVLLLAMVLAIPATSFTTYYAHLLPEPGWYYQFRSIPGTELLVVFVGIAGGLVGAWLPRVVRLVPLFGVAAFSIIPILKPFLGPIPMSEFEDKWRGEVCLQSTPSTCGAASLATILRGFGMETTEVKMAGEAHSYVGGTEAWYLARAARARGCAVRFDMESDAVFTPEKGLPAIAGVKFGVVGHFIPVLAKEGDGFVIGDPLRGREVLSRAELQRRYEFTGFHMRLQRP